MKLSVTAGMFEEKKIPENEPKAGLLELSFLNLVYNASLLFTIFLNKPLIWEIIGS